MTEPVAINRPYRRSVLAWLHLMRIYQRVVRVEQTLLAKYGLTRSQFDVLGHIATEPGLSQQALAERLLVTKGNVAGLIDRLEDAGMVERCDAPEDRRMHRLFLTDKGLAAFEQAAPALEATLHCQPDALSAEAQAQPMGLLAFLVRALRVVW